MTENPIVWNLERAVEHLRAAYSISKDEKDITKHADLREVLESINLTLGTVVQRLQREDRV